MSCDLCPRQCNIDRKTEVGFCRAPDTAVVAKATLHFHEEPIISGQNGSGAVFFSGCNLRCVFCQNKQISRRITGTPYNSDGLYGVFVSLAKQGAHNINLVTPTPYIEFIIPALKKLKAEFDLPVVYNCGGYESAEALKRLDGLVDVYLPDFKYRSREIAEKYSCAGDYFDKATLAIGEMYRQQKEVKIEDGLIKKGVVIRHLVLPSHYRDSVEIVRYIARHFPGAKLSLMSQYTPSFYEGDCECLKRKVTTFEYNKVLSEVIELGLDGYCQQRESASSIYTPDFQNG